MFARKHVHTTVIVCMHGELAIVKKLIKKNFCFTSLHLFVTFVQKEGVYTYNDVCNIQIFVPTVCSLNANRYSNFILFFASD